MNNPSGIVVKQLGAFDHQGNGITGTQSGGIRVAIFNKSTHNIVTGLDAIIIGNSDHYTGNHRMKDITPVTLMPGDYVIVSKGYNAGELNGNTGISGVTATPGGDVTNGSISYTGTGLYGNPDPSTFAYPVNADNGPANKYLAGTFVFDVPGAGASGPGNYTVNITAKDTHGNTANATAVVTVTDPTGACAITPWSPAITSANKQAEAPLLEAEKTKSLKVYPNPNRGTFTVQVTGFSGVEATVQLFNETGEMIQEKTIARQNKMLLLSVPFNLLNQPAGLYYIKVVSKNGVQTAKVIIQR